MHDEAWCPLKRSCWLHNCGVVPYPQAWDWQKQLVRDRIQSPDAPETLILLEHPPVYTLGQGSTLAHLKFDPDVASYELHRIERGGEVTYHCPGQIVGYPILNLKFFQPDLHWYLRQLEEVILQTLDRYGLKGDRIPGLTGVWVEGYKVAAIGIKVSRWITMHGFALNVCPDLSGFERIVPCGIADRPVARLSDWIPDIDPLGVRNTLAEIFADVFDVELVPATSYRVRGTHRPQGSQTRDELFEF
ncbi:MAG: lipoyl(octanoyl) transferase LipB [Acaryochloridaceae cyanobacterium RU_4_10]|nr:lipoyl(octanoyl) transferase LipB [Acaryochloridaceae cyanobacterium RU_4_10]